MECSSVPLDGAGSGSLRVRDVMRARPKTLAAEATVADLRRLFTNGHVRTAILAEDSAFVGSVDRDGLDPTLPDHAPARDAVRRDPPTIGADEPVAEAMRRLDELGEWRLIVVGADGSTLEGLLCLNSERTGFCT